MHVAMISAEAVSTPALRAASVAAEGVVGVRIAVARVEHVADHELVAGGDGADRLQHVWERGARHHRVLDDEVARQAAHGAERLLTALPQALTLGGIGGSANAARAVTGEHV